MSATTTNFDQWLDEVNLSWYGDVYALHQAIESETSFLGFTAERALNGKLIVSAPRITTKLVLVSDRAKETVLNLICAQHVEPGMQIDIWYAMNHANDSD